MDVVEDVHGRGDGSHAERGIVDMGEPAMRTTPAASFMVWPV